MNRLFIVTRTILAAQEKNCTRTYISSIATGKDMEQNMEQALRVTAQYPTYLLISQVYHLYDASYT